jgi:hypothetical protein
MIDLHGISRLAHHGHHPSSPEADETCLFDVLHEVIVMARTLPA